MNKTKLAVAMTFASLVSLNASAEVKSPRMMGVYGYEIGGSGLPGAPTKNNSMNVFTLGVEWETNMQCGSFDPKISVSNQLNGITDGFKSMMGNIINSATGAVASLPALIIQRANPGLYDLLQQGVLQGKLDVDFAETSCEDIQGMIMGDKAFPWEQATAATRQQTWGDKIESSGGDAVKAKDDYDAVNIGNAGRDWVCGEKRGGTGQPKVDTVYDVVVAGYNMYHKRLDTCDNGSPTALERENSDIYKYWTSADAAGDWVTEVVGEVRLDTCNTCKKIETMPGVSLEVKHDEMAQDLQDDLQDLVDGATDPTWQNLNRVSAPPVVVITPALIRSLQARPGDGAVRLVEDIAKEVAYARMMEMSRLAVRMLRTGEKEPNVQSFPNAPEVIDDVVAVMRENIELINEAATKVQPVASKTVDGVLVNEEAGLRRTRPIFNATQDNAELRLQE